MKKPMATIGAPLAAGAWVTTSRATSSRVRTTDSRWPRRDSAAAVARRRSRASTRSTFCWHSSATAVIASQVRGRNGSRPTHSRPNAPNTSSCDRHSGTAVNAFVPRATNAAAASG
ncbi:MAG: hypothetical protein QM733_20325 [Ilumatobacteraceae bacterium]